MVSCGSFVALAPAQEFAPEMGVVMSIRLNPTPSAEAASLELQLGYAGAVLAQLLVRGLVFTLDGFLANEGDTNLDFVGSVVLQLGPIYRPLADPEPEPFPVLYRVSPQLDCTPGGVFWVEQDGTKEEASDDIAEHFNSLAAAYKLGPGPSCGYIGNGPLQGGGSLCGFVGLEVNNSGWLVSDLAVLATAPCLQDDIKAIVLNETLAYPTPGALLPSTLYSSEVIGGRVAVSDIPSTMSPAAVCARLGVGLEAGPGLGACGSLTEGTPSDRTTALAACLTWIESLNGDSDLTLTLPFVTVESSTNATEAAVLLSQTVVGKLTAGVLVGFDFGSDSSHATGNLDRILVFGTALRNSLSLLGTSQQLAVGIVGPSRSVCSSTVVDPSGPNGCLYEPVTRNSLFAQLSALAEFSALLVLLGNENGGVEGPVCGYPVDRVVFKVPVVREFSDVCSEFNASARDVYRSYSFAPGTAPSGRLAMRAGTGSGAALLSVAAVEAAHAPTTVTAPLPTVTTLVTCSRVGLFQPVVRNGGVNPCVPGVWEQLIVDRPGTIDGVPSNELCGFESFAYSTLGTVLDTFRCGCERPVPVARVWWHTVHRRAR